MREMGVAVVVAVGDDEDLTLWRELVGREHWIEVTSW